VSDPNPSSPLAPADLDPAADPGASSPSNADAPAETNDRVDLSGLSIAGITRRRVGWLAATLVSIWIVIVFARQVGDATAAADRATKLATDNTTLAAEVAALEQELAQVTKPEYIDQEARGYQLGKPTDIPFALDGSVPPPGDGAPGSAALRLGADDHRQTPIESWLSLLFGPG
jgi:cell division protein FtsB